MLKLFLLSVIFLFNSMSLPAKAYFPKIHLDFDNVKMKRIYKERAELALLNYLEDYPEVLKPAGKRYKKDQYCKYEMELLSKNKVDVTSIKVLDKKKNLSYNLKVIEFLRGYKEFNIEKKDEDKPITISFKYYAF